MINKLVQWLKNRNKLKKVIIKIYRVVFSIIRDNHWLNVAFHKIQTKYSNKTRIDFYRQQSVKEYSRIHHLDFKVLEEEKYREVFIPPYYNDHEASQVVSYKSPQIYITKLLDVSIIGGNSYFLKDTFVLYDMFEMDTDHRFDLRFGSIVSISKKGEVVIETYTTEIEKIEKGIFLIGFGSFNYYHLTVELLSKFKYINECEDYDNYPLIVDELVLTIPQFKDLVDSLNITGREIIPLKKYAKYEVAEIVYISDVSWMPINLKGSLGLTNEDCRVSGECIEYLRNQVMRSNNISFSSDSSVKLYLSRKSSFLQRLVNEKKVASLFESYGFKVVYPEELSLKQQVELFASASVVVGSTGAALTNIIYCQPGTVLVSIIPKEFNFNVYSTMAHHLKIDSLYLHAQIIKRGVKISEDLFELDLNLCERFIKEHFMERSKDEQ